MTTTQIARSFLSTHGLSTVEMSLLVVGELTGLQMALQDRTGCSEFELQEVSYFLLKEKSYDAVDLCNWHREWAG